MYWCCQATVGIFLLAGISTVTAVGDANATVSQTASPFPVSDVRNCPTQQWFDRSQSSRLLEVLPGLGFDHLRSMDMAQVHFYNYSLCKATTDGKFIIPDGTFVVPIQESHYKFSADFFDHWDNYTSITSSKVGSGFSLLNILGGSFSKEKTSVKQNQVNLKSKTTRVTFRNTIYNVKLDAAAELHPTFKSKIYEIAARLQNNDTQMAYYLSELLVRDYGTHFITSVDAGAVFAKIDYVSQSYTRSANGESITSAAAFSFPILQLLRNSSFDLGYSYSSSMENVQEFYRGRMKSEIFTIGGTPFTADLNLNNWLKEVPDKMAIIDRTADPLHYVITPSRFPELRPSTVRNVSDYVQTAIKWYYQLNKRPGCTDPSAKNFDFQANYDDSSYCNTTLTYEDMAFGGTYQVCNQQVGSRENLCNGVLQNAHMNPQTGGYNCPTGYTSVLLHEGTVSHSNRFDESKKSCTFFIFCSTRTVWRTYSSYASYKAYWCVAVKKLRPSAYRGYLFGGYFTKTKSNPLTGTNGCPPYFQTQKIASDVSVCVSNDYELASAHSVRFGGFHSCLVGNPLAIPANSNVTMFTNSEHWPHSCPSKYSQHLVDIENGCEINVCLEHGAFTHKGLMPPYLPPFHQQPPFVPHWTDKLAVVGAANNLLIRNTQGQWKAYSSDSDETKAFIEIALENNNISSASPSEIGVVADTVSSQAQPSKWALISLILSSTALASLILVLCMTSILTCKVCCGGKKRGEKKMGKIEEGRVPLIVSSTESQQL